MEATDMALLGDGKSNVTINRRGGMATETIYLSGAALKDKEKKEK